MTVLSFIETLYYVFHFKQARYNRKQSQKKLLLLDFALCIKAKAYTVNQLLFAG